MKFNILIGGLAVVAVFSLLFGMWGLFDQPSSAVPPVATPTSGATPTATPTPTTTTKPATTPGTTPAATTTSTTIPTTTPAATPKPTGKLLKEWTGNGPKTTESFTIAAAGAPWQVYWSSNPTLLGVQSMGSFQIVLLDSKSAPLSIVAPTTTKKEENVVTLQQAGTYFLKINANDTQWKVQVYTK